MCGLLAHYLTLTEDATPPEMPPMDQTREGRLAFRRAEQERSAHGDNGDWRPPQRNVIVTYRAGEYQRMVETAAAEQIVHDTPLHERQQMEKYGGRIYLSPDVGLDSELDRGYQMGNVFASRGMPRPVAAYNKRIEGWRYMHGKLMDTFNAELLGNVQQFPMWCITAKKDERGLYHPGFGAPHALDAIPWATRDPLKDGDILAKGDNPNLDRLDSLRYGVASYELSNDKPTEVRRRERTAQVPVEGTGRLTTGWAFDVEDKPKTQPFYNYGVGQALANRWGRRRHH